MSFILIQQLIILMLTLKFASSQFYTSPSQYLALKTIYDSFNGPTWAWSNESLAWNFDDYTVNNPCSVEWEGVICLNVGCGPNSGNTYCPIISIDLTSKNLTGNFDTLFYYDTFEEDNLVRSAHLELDPEPEASLDSLQAYNQRILQSEDVVMTDSLELFSNLSTLLNFSLGGNFIHGQLPSFFPLDKIISLNLTSNYFTGQIPPDLINEDSLIILLYLSNNYLTGVIPEGFFSKLNSLQYFSLYMNQLHGNINNDIRSLTNLIYLNIANNMFSGTLPISSLNNFESLKQFIGYSNSFSGKLPDLLDSENTIESVYLYDNAFTGSIPSSYCQFNTLKILSLGDNSLTGSIPTCLSNLTNLNIISLQSNYFKNTITNIFNATIQTGLSYIDVSDNAITGEIPNEIFNLKSLYVVSLAKNCFHGNLPSNICDAASNYLQVLSMDGLMASSKCKGGKDDYYFHPIFTSNAVESYGSDYFRFSFSSDGIFSDYSKYITNNKNRNLLRSTDEEDIHSFQEDLNNYEISIPSLVPYMSQSFFLIDWIRALKFFFSNPITMKGSLPQCVWSLPNVTIMHFSGNGLKGSLPTEFPSSYNINNFGQRDEDSDLSQRKVLLGSVNPSSKHFSPVYTSHSKNANQRLKSYHLDKKKTQFNKISSNLNIESLSASDGDDQPILRDSTHFNPLKDVCLAYNRLSGTIPESFNYISLQNIDLSFNKLTGSANNLNNFPNTTDIDPNSSYSYGVDIRSNRLSGGVPSKWVNVPNMNVLSGNLFHCKADHSDLPSSDPDLSGYICGSEAMNSALYVTGISYFLMFFTVLVIIYSFKGMGELPLEIWKFLRAVHYTYYYSRRICIQLDALSEVYSLLWSGEDLDYSEITKGMMLKGGNHHHNHPMQQKLQLISFENTPVNFIPPPPIVTVDSQDKMEVPETINPMLNSPKDSPSTSFSIINDYSSNLYRNSNRTKNQSFSARLSITSEPHNEKSQHISDMLGSDTINNYQIFEEEDKAEEAEFASRESSSNTSFFSYYYNYAKASLINFYKNLSFSYIWEQLNNFLSFLLHMFFSLLHIIFRTCSNLFKEYSPFSSSNIVNISNLPSIKEREYILKYSNLFQYLRLLSKLRILAIVIGVYTLIVLLPVYLGFYNSLAEKQNNSGSMKYSTHTQVYGWVMTSTYLTGTTCGYVLFFLWIIILGWTMLMILMHYHVYMKEEPTGLKKNMVSMNKRLKHYFNYIYEGRLKADVVAFINNKKYNKDKVVEEVYDVSNPVSSDVVVTENSDKDIEKSAQDDEKNLLQNSSPIQPFKDVESVDIPNSLNSPYIEDETNVIPLANMSSDLSKDDDQSILYPKRLPPSHKLPLFGPPREYILDRSERKISFRNFMKYFIIFVINMTVCIIINSAYLSGEEDNGGSSSSNSAIFSFKYVLQLGMAIFKIFWNIVILRNIILGFLPYTPTTTRFHLFMLIVNNVITPILTMFITNSSSCFNHLITQKSEVVTTNYYLNMCVESYDHLDLSDQQIYSTCTNYMELENVIEFEPKFVYFFTCKSEFLKRYIPVFVYTYTFLFIFKLFDHNFFIGCSKILPERYTACYVDGVLLPSWRGKVTFSRLIRSHANMVMLIQHIVVLLTFGLCSPVLALLIVIYMILDTTKWQMLITRYIKYDCEGNPFHPIPKNELIVEEEEELDVEGMTGSDDEFKQQKKRKNKNKQKKARKKNELPNIITNEPISHTINPLFGSNQDDDVGADIPTTITTPTLINPESSPQKRIRKKKIKQFSKNEFRRKKNQIKHDHFDDARISIISATNASSTPSTPSTPSLSVTPFKPTVVPIQSNNSQSLDDKSTSRNLSSSFTNFDIDMNNFYCDDYLDDDSVLDDSINGDNFSDVSNSEYSISSFNSMYSVQGSIRKKPLVNQIKIEKRNFIHEQLENLNFSNVVLAENESSQNNEDDESKNEENPKPEGLTKTREEERLEEFHFMMGDSWRCLMNAKWTILYSCMFFYFSMIYDSIGDDKGMIKALIVVSLLCGSIVIFVRFFLKQLIIKYMDGRVKTHKLFLNTI